ncbi:MAG: acylneuraminate cytidylyltransferase family protein [Ruminococcus sp.]|uniref:acylneuraminate cytidylyltransferase family protein n=1 Tax=uncultured Ruminococcus sp. TaxID=165186 RepID=UPI00258F5C20|nr:acylneuraminate cytidylyltransferase family protein [Ruminococcus sp.]MCI5598735.1 acylneuraminate cytidylyltransferase family protein [Ruminococcus sp.]
MKVVAFVPIKLNSQRLPHKNILPIAGHPLCWHLCNTLLKVNNIDEVYVYCSDERVSDYIPEGVILKKRDKKLDGDLVKGFDIYKSFISEVDADVYVLAHTTSPFIRQESIDNALKHIVSGSNDSAFSAEKIQTFAWYKDKPINYDLNDVPRTQDLEPIWVETSAFFMFKKEIFTDYNRRIGFNPYIQEVSGIEAIDIDEKKDYDLACQLAKIEGV